MAVPPFEGGADQETTADVSPRIAETPVGVLGSTSSVIEDDGEDDGESPTLFLATTVNVTGLPFVKPVIVDVKTFPTVTGDPEDGVIM